MWMWSQTRERDVIYTTLCMAEERDGSDGEAGSFSRPGAPFISLFGLRPFLSLLGQVVLPVGPTNGEMPPMLAEKAAGF